MIDFGSIRRAATRIVAVSAVVAATASLPGSFPSAVSAPVPARSRDAVPAIAAPTFALDSLAPIADRFVATSVVNGKPTFRVVPGTSLADAKQNASAIPNLTDVSADVPAQALGDVAVTSTPNDPLRGDQWNMDRLKVDELTATLPLSGQVVAVLDTGVNPNHNDFAAGTVLCAQGEDLTGDGLSTDGCVDPHGHGTHVSGIIAAARNNGIGIEGMAAGVKILPIRVLNAAGSGSTYNIAQGIIDATDKGATVINMSLGGPYSSYYDPAIAYAVAHNVVVVAAAGNNAASGNDPNWPAANASVVAVAASDDTDAHAYFSTYGSQVKITAPGVSIESLKASNNSQYVYMSGTSQASPHVAALAAMIRAKNNSWTASQVIAQMTSTATDLGTPGRDDYFGAGLINPLSALTTVPVAPVLTSATAGNANAIVDWSTPADGGAQITGYRVVATPTSGSPVTADVAATVTRPYTLSGLANGVSYNVGVLAKNSDGYSSSSSTTSVTPTSGVTTTTSTTVAPPTSTTTSTTAAPPTSTTTSTTSTTTIAPTTTTSAPHVTQPPTTQPPVVQAPPHTAGAWTVAGDGGIFSFGGAQFFGSTGAMHLNQPVVGMASTATGNGYWFVASDGGIFGFGDAGFEGSLGGTHLNQPVVGMASTPSGHGYWLVARDGGIFAFGDAPFKGSTGNIKLNQPIIGMTPTASGQGYWFVAADGGIFAFGDAGFYGSLGGQKLATPVVGMASTTSGHGYWLAQADGTVTAFGDAAWAGNAPAGLSGIIAGPTGGYTTASLDGRLTPFGTMLGYLQPTNKLALNKPIVGTAIAR